MSLNTNQRFYSAMTPMMPWRGLKVLLNKLDGDGVDYVNETHDHVGTWQALAYMYGGVMAVTYRAGVDASSSNLTLPKLRSDATSAGTQIYFVSLDNKLGIGELANGTPTASSTNSALTISAVTETTAAMSTNDGTVVAPIARAVEFRVTLPTSTFANTEATILIHYPTDGSNAGNVSVKLPIEWNA